MGSGSAGFSKRKEYIRLTTVMLGKQRYTSKEAYERFMEAIDA